MLIACMHTLLNLGRPALLCNIITVLTSTLYYYCSKDDMV